MYSNTVTLKCFRFLLFYLWINASNKINQYKIFSQMQAISQKYIFLKMMAIRDLHSLLSFAALCNFCLLIIHLSSCYPFTHHFCRPITISPLPFLPSICHVSIIFNRSFFIIKLAIAAPKRCNKSLKTQ